MTISLPSPVNRATGVRRAARFVLALAVLAGIALPAQPAAAADPWDRTLDITFPALKGSRFTNDYKAPRGGGTRMHCGTDIMGAKHSPIYAARGGKITFMPLVKPSYGYTINIAGDDGRRYSYIHLNDDTPGTRDAKAGPEHAYAPGLKVGSIVRRGQLIGYMGDSGNAKGGVDHLHFEIHDPSVTNPACTNGGGANRVNPFFSLTAAVNRGDHGGAAAPAPAPAPAPALSPRSIDLACPTARVASSSFSDVSGTHARPIDCIAWWKIATGHNGQFQPENQISREQLAGLVVRTFDALGQPLPASPVDHFHDDDNSVHQDAINRLAHAGIVSRSPTGRYNPAAVVPRSQMATILSRAYERAAGRPLPAGPNAFGDDDGNVHEAAINRLAAARVAVGTDASSFSPDRPVSRAAMASFLARTLDILVEQRSASLPK
jgi:hypothetical protein